MDDALPLANSLALRVPLSGLKSRTGESVIVCGWVSAVRKQKAVQFVVLRDGLDLVQLVNDRDDNPGVADDIDSLRPESVVAVRGVVEANDRVRLGGLELRVLELEIISLADELPLGKDASLEVRQDWRFIDLRSTRNQLLFRLQTDLEREFREYCIHCGFIEINSPKLMASPSESRSELFEVAYFERKAYLAQSPQFYKQMGIAAGLPGVFETGPVFRANPSFTSRHDTEFTSLDVELAWVSSHEDVMRFEEQLLHRIIGCLKDRYGDLVRELFGAEIVVPALPFPRVTHAAALEAVESSGYRTQRADGDLDPEAERRLAALIRAELGHEFVFVTEYPVSLRPFYHMRMEPDSLRTRSFDLLWKGLEITTGAQREHRHARLVSQVIDKGLDPGGLEFYLDFFRFGCPPHGGLGLGLTRLLMLLLDLDNVREVTYLYRGPNRLSP